MNKSKDEPKDESKELTDNVTQVLFLRQHNGPHSHRTCSGETWRLFDF